jgi:hypothetical protein
LYGAETGTLGRVDQKCPGSLECNAGEEWRSIGAIVRCHGVKEERNIL